MEPLVLGLRVQKIKKWMFSHGARTRVRACLRACVCSSLTQGHGCRGYRAAERQPLCPVTANQNCGLGAFNTRGHGAPYSCTTAIPNLTTCFYGIYLFQHESENLGSFRFFFKFHPLSSWSWWRHHQKSTLTGVCFLRLQQFRHTESVVSLSFPVAE